VVVHISTVPFQILEGCPFHYWFTSVLFHIFLRVSGDIQCCP
jgi:hypothetical protein